ncbi:Aspartic proteinase PCS1 [Ananas comosus]|uniref:Aspartic proteinase PCS1 n=1 Tax=Ananas comosus TaxID=4615 RepID=A0A199UTJ2_ANACO|nr:Aspartic proteinase PCS1 [Ananas comosus]
MAPLQQRLLFLHESPRLRTPLLHLVLPIPCSSPTCRAQARDPRAPAACDAGGRVCDVSVSYADGSSSEGALASDLFRLGDAAAPLRTVFGCMSSASSSSSSAAAAAAAATTTTTTGMLGMDRGALSFVTQSGTRRFSYCISDRDAAGVLLLGRSPLPLPLNYTPLSRPPPLPLPYFDRAAYSVRLLGIRVGGALLPLPASALAPDHTGAGQTMVDSGTQFTFLLGDAYAALRAEFLRRTRGVLRPLDYAFEGAFDLCFRTPEGAAAPATRRLPAVALELEGAEVAVEGERLLYEVGNGVRCLTFGNADLAGISAFVIGHHHQQNLWVEYDLDNARLGFAPVRCDLATQRLGLLL